MPTTLRTIQLARALTPPMETIWTDEGYGVQAARLAEQYGGGIPAQIKAFANQRARQVIENHKEGAHNPPAQPHGPTPGQHYRDQSEDRPARYIVVSRESKFGLVHYVQNRLGERCTVYTLSAAAAIRWAVLYEREGETEGSIGTLVKEAGDNSDTVGYLEA